MPQTPKAIFPDHWCEAARDAAEQVLDARPDLDGTQLPQLEAACELLNSAAICDRVAAEANYVSRTDRGAPTIHPAVQEARMARQQASVIFARLTKTEKADRSSIGSKAAHSRWRP